MSSVERALEVPSEIRVRTAGPLVVLFLDPSTADQVSAALELGAALSLFDESTRPGWRREVEEISRAAVRARDFDVYGTRSVS